MLKNIFATEEQNSDCDASFSKRLCTARRALCTAVYQRALYSVHCSMYSVHCVMHCALCFRTWLCTVVLRYTVPCASTAVHQAGHCIQLPSAVRHLPNAAIAQCTLLALCYGSLCQLCSAVHQLPKELRRFNDCCCCALVYHDFQTPPPYGIFCVYIF